MEDNYSLWEAKTRREEAWLEEQPVCDYCGEHIQDEECFDDGEKRLCLECLKNNFIKRTEDLIA